MMMMMMISTDAGSCYIETKCTHATSLGTFKRRLDEHHPALLRHFASLVLLYKTLDLLTYLRTAFYSVHSGVMQICYSDPARCLFMEKYY